VRTIRVDLGMKSLAASVVQEPCERNRGDDEPEMSGIMDVEVTRH
jgi:hypothetical protein